MAHIKIRIEEAETSEHRQAIVPLTFFDAPGLELFVQAVTAVAGARDDGREKYPHEAWKDETVTNQMLHAREHLQSMGTLFSPEDARHAICRLAIALALYQSQEKK